MKHSSKMLILFAMPNFAFFGTISEFYAANDTHLIFVARAHLYRVLASRFCLLSFIFSEIFPLHIYLFVICIHYTKKIRLVHYQMKPDLFILIHCRK